MIKKFFIFGIICAIIFPSVVLATSKDLVSNTNNSGEIVYIKDYEEYENLMDEFDENKVNKNEYIKQLVGDLQELAKNSEIPLYKAKVLSISEPEMRYTQDQATAEYGMGLYQNGEVEVIEEGVLFGKKLSYMTCLTYDVYGNITLPEIKVGDVLNIALMEIDESTVIAISPELDTYVDRFPTMLWIAGIILFMIIVFLGKHVIKMIIPLLLMINILFGVVGPQILEGFNLWILVFFALVLNSIAICVLKLGVNIRSFIATFVTVLVSACIIPIHAILDNLLNFAGLTTESFLMSSGVTPNVWASEVVNIFNFHSLSIATTLFIGFGLIALVACKTSEKYEENKAKLKGSEIISEEVKSYIAEMSFVAVTVMIANALPKYMLLIVKSYTPENIIQSEIFLIEFLRILVVLLALIITVPLTLIFSKFLED